MLGAAEFVRTLEKLRAPRSAAPRRSPFARDGSPAMNWRASAKAIAKSDYGKYLLRVATTAK
jgi:hypothetical protein